MIKTVLLLDGSEAMNSTADYQPNYLFASRQPVLQYVRSYLRSTTLASLGLVVMQDGTARTLLPCTTNVHDLLTTLETQYFMYGGSGCLSLENGLRSALAQLVESPQSLMNRSSKRGRANRGSASPKTSLPQSSGAGGGERTSTEAKKEEEGEEEVMEDAIECRILLFAASVTIIDPTDVFRVVRLLERARVTINVVSLSGAVHVFQECADRTRGRLFCPLHYKHLGTILKQLANEIVPKHGGGKNASSLLGGRHQSSLVRMITIGFARPTTRVVKRRREATGLKDESPSQKNKVEEDDPAGGLVSMPRIECPSCGHPQTSIPSTCQKCLLRLCSVPSIYSMFVARHSLLPPVKALHTTGSTFVLTATQEDVTTINTTSGTPPFHKENTDNEDNKDPHESISSSTPVGSFSAPMHCALCTFHVPAVVMCQHCGVPRCAECQAYCEQVLSLCPTCIALQ